MSVMICKDNEIWAIYSDPSPVTKKVRVKKQSIGKSILVTISVLILVIGEFFGLALLLGAK